MAKAKAIGTEAKAKAMAFMYKATAIITIRNMSDSLTR